MTLTPFGNNGDRDEVLLDMVNDFGMDHCEWFKNVEMDEDIGEISVTIIDPDNPVDPLRKKYNFGDFHAALVRWSKLRITSSDTWTANVAKSVRERNWDRFDYDPQVTDQVLQLMIFNEIRYS